MKVVGNSVVWVLLYLVLNIDVIGLVFGISVVVELFSIFLKGDFKLGLYWWMFLGYVLLCYFINRMVSLGLLFMLVKVYMELNGICRIIYL